MKRDDLGWPLRQGPWWVGVIVLCVVFVPAFVLVCFGKTREAFEETIGDLSNAWKILVKSRGAK